MGVRLLSKQEITQKKNSDLKSAMDEGRNLAKQITELRNLRLKEEAEFNSFRVSTLAAINEEINAEYAKLNTLKSEVEIAEKKKARALEPLTLEKEEILVGKEELKIEREELDSKTKELDAREIQVASTEVTTTKEALSTKLMRDILNEEIKDFHAERNAKITSANNSEKEAKKLLKEAETTYANAKEREEYILNREKEVAKKEEQNRKEDKKIQGEWKKLRDRQETLKRSIKRLNN